MSNPSASSSRATTEFPPDQTQTTRLLNSDDNRITYATMDSPTEYGKNDLANSDPVRQTTSHSNDPEMEGLTLYEKKCVLINREMDSNGMGKYQWWIWSLCGFGFLLDLMWAQAFGLVLGSLEQELGFPGRSHALDIRVIFWMLC